MSLPPDPSPDDYGLSPEERRKKSDQFWAEQEKSMARWSISKRFSDISYEEFQSLSNAFAKAAARSFGTTANIEVTAMSVTKSYSTIPNPLTWRDEKKLDEQDTFFKGGLGKMTKSIWEQATYIEINVRPVDETKAKRSAFAQAAFKGMRPKGASFYIQCSNDAPGVKKETLKKRPRLSKVGDGYHENNAFVYTPRKF